MDLKRLIPRTKTQRWGLGMFLIFTFGLVSGLSNGRTDLAALGPSVFFIFLFAGIGLYLWVANPRWRYIASLTKTQKWGFGIFLFSIFGILTGLVSLTGGLGLDVGSSLAMAIFYALLAGLGFYIWRSKAPSEYFAKKTAQKQQRDEAAIDSALRRLEGLSGAKAVVAYESLETLVRKRYKAEANKKLNELLDSVQFDRSRVESQFIGSVTNAGAGLFVTGTNGQIRVFKDWVIAGQNGYDFDISTRGEVNVDGSFSYDKNNNKVDNRTASLLLATQDWSHSFKILPDQADEARRILNQLNAVVEQMKPKAVSAAEITEAMERLMNASGKSPAEKLEELSNLRYQRLLSDKEFEQAKGRILGI